MKSSWDFYQRCIVLLYGGGKEKRTAKGITRVNQRQMKHEQYKTSLFQLKATGVVGHII